MKRCFFIGHGDCRENIYPRLYESVIRHVEIYGVGEFIVGQYGNFDHMSARAVLQAKEKYPQIKLVLLCPYRTGVNLHLHQGFDELFYPFDCPVPHKYAIVQANKKAISMCDYLIAYVYRIGKSKDFLEFAERRHKKGLISIENISL